MKSFLRFEIHGFDIWGKVIDKFLLSRIFLENKDIKVQLTNCNITRKYHETCLGLILVRKICCAYISNLRNFLGFDSAPFAPLRHFEPVVHPPPPRHPPCGRIIHRALKAKEPTTCFSLSCAT